MATLMLSLRTNFDAARAQGVEARTVLRCGDETVGAEVAGGALTVERGEPAGDGTVVTGAPPMIASVVYGGRPLDAAVSDGDLAVDGDPAVAQRFFELFTLPPVATRG